MTTCLLWLKFGHFVGLICWMAGLFYLPRLFVYHMESPEEMAPIFQKMERRLYKYIIRPAAAVTWFCGTGLIFLKSTWQYGYFYIKFLCLVGMFFFQLFMEHYRVLLLHHKRPALLFRFLNEIPTLLLIIIVYCAVFKPF